MYREAQICLHSSTSLQHLLHSFSFGACIYQLFILVAMSSRRGDLSSRNFLDEKKSAVESSPQLHVEDAPNSFKLDRHPYFDGVLSLLVGIVVMIGYYPTVFKSTPGGDSGELLAEACQLGVAHPPGYPLFVYFAKASMMLFKSLDGSPAYRVNLACSILGALTASMLYYNSVRLIYRVNRYMDKLFVRIISASVAIAFAFSPEIWLYSVGAEVFSLNNFMIATLLTLLVSFADALHYAAVENEDETLFNKALKSIRWRVALSAFVCGIAMCNQHTSILLILPMALLVFYAHLPFLSVRSSILYLFAGLLGLSLYLHMPLAHKYWRGPGSWGDTTTLSGFIRHLLRADYGTFRLLAREGVTENFLERTFLWLKDLCTVQISPFFFPLFPVAIFALLFVNRLFSSKILVSKKLRSYPVLRKHLLKCSYLAPFSPLLFLAFYICIFHYLSNMPLQSDELLYGIHSRFWLQPNILSFVTIAVGITCMANGIIYFLAPKPSSRKHTAKVVVPFPVPDRSLKLILSLAFSFVPIALAYLQWQNNHIELDQSDNDVFEKYAKALLLPLPENAVLVTSYDMQWSSTRYLQTCEGVRPDVQILNAPVMSYEWFAAQQSLYPKIHFPGTHMVKSMTPDHAKGGFTFSDFLIANTFPNCGKEYFQSYLSNPPHELFDNEVRKAHVTELDNCSVAHGGIYWAGSVPNADSYGHVFYEIPHGLTARVIPKPLSKPLTWRSPASTDAPPSEPLHLTGDIVTGSGKAWLTASDIYDGTIDINKYTDKTWEKATRIDYWQSGANFATWLLDWALDPTIQAGKHKSIGVDIGEENSIDLNGTLFAASLLEECIYRQLEQNTPVSTNTWKNIGLSLFRLVRYSGDFPQNQPLPLLPAIRAQLDSNFRSSGRSTGIVVPQSVWKTLASERVLETWEKYLDLVKDAPENSSDDTIRYVVGVLRAAARNK